MKNNLGKIVFNLLKMPIITNVAKNTFQRVLLPLLKGTTVLGGLTGGLWYAGTRYKIAENTLTGTLTNVGDEGLFFKTTEVAVRPNKETNFGGRPQVGMSIFRNPKAKEAAKKFVGNGKDVAIQTESFLFQNPFAGNSKTYIRGINEVGEGESNDATKSSPKM